MLTVLSEYLCYRSGGVQRSRRNFKQIPWPLLPFDSGLLQWRAATGVSVFTVKEQREQCVAELSETAVSREEHEDKHTVPVVTCGPNQE